MSGDVRALELLDEEIRAVVGRVCMEWDIPVATAIGVLHIIASDIIHENRVEIEDEEEDDGF